MSTAIFLLYVETKLWGVSGK